MTEKIEFSAPYKLTLEAETNEKAETCRYLGNNLAIRMHKYVMHQI